MIKKLMLRALFVIMVIAFLGVVMVQWLWIKDAISERRSRFSSQVYSILNKIVGRVDEVNYLDYLRDMYTQINHIKSLSESISHSSSNAVTSVTSDYFSDMLKFDEDKTKDRSYIPNSPFISRSSRTGKQINKNVIANSMQSIFNSDSIWSNEMTFERLKNVAFKLMNERDPENVSIQERLSKIDMKTELKQYFEAYNIRIPFEYFILNKKEILEKVSNKNIDNLYYVELFPQDLIKKDSYLAVQFSSVQPLIIQNMNWLFVASAFCILGLLAVFIITVVIIMRQHKLSIVKNDFINNMTHEFKTPLATISLATAAIDNEKVLSNREQIGKFNAMIRKENERMNKYVERILQQAKLDKKVLQLNLKEIDMGELVRDSVEHFILQVREKGGNFTTEFKASPCVMLVDEVHLMNVICNLIDNAIKYSDATPDITVGTKDEANTFVIYVSDKGIGISRDDQKKVFRRFYRVHSGNLHNVKGFGLGLSYVKQIVLLHGGQVSLSSKKGRGTTVEVRLPRPRN